MKRSKTFVLVIGLVTMTAALCSGCDGDELPPPADAGVDGDATTDADTSDVGPDDGGGDGDADEVPSPWDHLDWRPIRDEGDPLADCRDDDSDCEADVVQLSYAVEEGTLYFDLRFAGPFQTLEVGSFEIFVLPPDADRLGHSIRSVAHTFTFWDAECASAQKHSGCHWYSTFELPTFDSEWVDESRLVCQVELAQWDYDGLGELYMGVAASPFVIQRTADFTDRYPDELWITAEEVIGLQLVEL